MKKLFLFILCFVFSLVVKSQNMVSACAGIPITLTATNPQNLTNPTYSLNPGGIINAAGVWTLNPTIPLSTYTLYTSGQNSTSSVITNSVVVTVTVLAQPQTAVTLTQATCSSSISALNLGLTFGSYPSPAYQVSWTPLPAVVLSPQQITAIGILPGPYTVSIITNQGCSTTTFFTINPIPQPANFTLSTPLTGYLVNCYTPTVSLHTIPSNYNYTWASVSSAPITGPVANLNVSQVGSWTVTGVNPTSGCTSTFTFALSQNFATPGSIISSTLINISCTQSVSPTISLTANPTVNITHQIYAPTGGTFAANTFTAVYSIGGPGTYTYCLFNTISGCSTCKNFTVTSAQGFPTYSIISQEHFTLGCSTKSIASLSIIMASTSPTGGAVSYTLIGPPTSTPAPTGTLTGISVYTLNVPGTWTVITRDNTSLCETRTPISIIQNTISPTVSAIVPRQILDCNVTATQLTGLSTDPNATFNWSTSGLINISQPSNTIMVTTNTTSPTNTLIGTYTLTLTDSVNACKNYSIIPMYQNTFPPNAIISFVGTNVLTCLTPTVVFINQSISGIPPGSGSPTNNPVIAYLWDGPFTSQGSPSYTAGIPGDYTLTVKDLNNGCTGKATAMVLDNRIYPSIVTPTAPIFLPCPGITTIDAIINGSSFNYTYSWTTPPGAMVTGLSAPSLTTSTPGDYKLLVTNTLNGCMSIGNYHVYACVGLAINSALSNIQLFPNPTNGVFTISSEGLQKTTSVEIYNSIGVLVKKQMLSSDKTILNMEGEAAGIYIIHLVQNNSIVHTSKIVKE